MTSPSRLAALTHPFWWAALVVLVVNDHWLKGSSVPGWLTGKLSDFAGLIVAPVLLACLVGGGRQRRAACFGFVAGGFVAINVSPAAAEGLVAALRSFGIAWRIWVDWTDLMALMVLPLAWHITTSYETCPSTWRRHLARGGAAMGGLACVATSEAAEHIETAAYVVNATEDELRIDLYRPTVPLDCDSVRADPEAALTAAELDAPSCAVLQPFDLVSLDLFWRDLYDSSSAPNPGIPRDCDAAVVRVAGAADTVVFWESTPKARVETSGYEVEWNVARDDPHSLLVEQLGRERLLSSGSHLRTWQVDWSLPLRASTCAEGP